MKAIPHSLNIRKQLFDLSEPQIMGIINCTPDSFHAGSRYQSGPSLESVIIEMVNEGASIIDFGGQSTRPGAVQVGIQEELDRVLPGIELAQKLFPNLVCSIDTFYGKVAETSIASGASIINDISAGSMDASILDVAAKNKVPYVLMHMQGKPSDMQLAPHYTDVTQEVFQFFQTKLALLRQLGVEDVIIDLGFGFGKTLSHNYELLRNLSVFHNLEKPILTGISRKSMIYKALNIGADEALNGSSILHAWALERGTQILRVHDVRQAKEAIKLWQLMRGY